MAGEHLPAAEKLPNVIRRRPRVTMTSGLAVSVVFAILATPILLADAWLPGIANGQFRSGDQAPFTVRTTGDAPGMAATSDREGQSNGPSGRIIVARGDTLDAGTTDAVMRELNQRPQGATGWLMLFIAMIVTAALYSASARTSHDGRLLRTQIVTLGLVLLATLAIKIATLFTAVSLAVIPIAVLGFMAALAVDITVGIATTLVGAALATLCVPFDLDLFVVLAVQGFTGVVLLSDGKHHSWPYIIGSGCVGGVMGAIVYAVLFYLHNGHVPVVELESPLQSPWLATVAGGALAGLLASLAVPAYQYFLGAISRNRLVILEDLSNPMLKQIAQQSPGTWQHSLAMANMAEIAANAIGANGRLIRVGAYYHDLGKSLQPQYFIENLGSGEASPHDRLPPEVSADAIFAHVVEGVRKGREAGLPERVIDFMHMHHGNGVLEYFWSKCQEQGNPNGLTVDDFRYPGVEPQTRETAILAIVDAVEAASRTLKSPDERSIRNLVQRIVYGKLHLGQLDESGLSMSELRKISDSLMDTIKHAFHGRIEYPWQKEEQEDERQEREQERRERTPSPLTVRRHEDEPRLDSLDVPRPNWARTAQIQQSQASTPLGTAQTQPFDSRQDIIKTTAGKALAQPATPAKGSEAPIDPSTKSASATITQTGKTVVRDDGSSEPTVKTRKSDTAAATAPVNGGRKQPPPPPPSESDDFDASSSSTSMPAQTRTDVVVLPQATTDDPSPGGEHDPSYRRQTSSK